MRIAQIAPLYESVPPKLYGGTERVVAHLTNALVENGHDVVLFASGDSTTSAQLVPGREVALRLDRQLSWDIPAHFAMLAEIRKRAKNFDILHFHLDCFHLPLFTDIVGRTLTTVHGRQDINDLHDLHLHYPNYPLVPSRKPSVNRSHICGGSRRSITDIRSLSTLSPAAREDIWLQAA
jgi:glycosyltransferase involved in cell wall biosynthesis